MLDDDEGDRPLRSRVIRGAEGPLTPDADRPLEQVIDDHALRAWGRLRDRDQLDSAGAVKVLGGAMHELLVALNGVKRVRKRQSRQPGRPRRYRGDA